MMTSRDGDDNDDDDDDVNDEDHTLKRGKVQGGFC